MEMFRMIEKHEFNGNEFDIEVKFTDIKDAFGYYDIVRVTGSEGMSASDYMNRHIRDTYGRNQLQKRMEDYVNNQLKSKK
jgi:spore coat polysaccharide biosynthesis protein SpsF (cytidylyltransferase family)